MPAKAKLDFSTLSDVELRELLELPPGRDGLRYYLSKQAKLAFLTTNDPAVKAKLLEQARKAQREHHQYLAERRRNGPPDRQALIEKKLGGVPWRFVGVRQQKTFRDECTGRKAKVAYTLQNTQTGVKIKVTRSTVNDAHERLGLILNWPQPAGRPALVRDQAEPTAASLVSHRERRG